VRHHLGAEHRRNNPVRRLAQEVPSDFLAVFRVVERRSVALLDSLFHERLPFGLFPHPLLLGGLASGFPCLFFFRFLLWRLRLLLGHAPSVAQGCRRASRCGMMGFSPALETLCPQNRRSSARACCST